MIENYTHVIWDWNGTIFEDVELSHDIICKLMVQYNLKTISIDEYKECFTIPVRNYYEKIGFDFSRESFEIVGRKWMDEYERRKFECGLYSGIMEVLSRIKSLGINQSILSAYSQHTLDEMVDHYGIREYFTYVMGLDNIYAAGKLHLGIRLMELINSGNEKVLFIGDTIHDLEVASEIGAECVLLSNGHQSLSNLKELSSNYRNVKIIPSIDRLFL